MVGEHWSLVASLAGNLLGQFAHFLKQVVIARQSGATIGMRQYWLGHVPETLLSIIFSGVGEGLMASQGVLSFSSGFATGFAADSMSDVWGTRAQAIMRSEKPGQ